MDNMGLRGFSKLEVGTWEVFSAAANSSWFKLSYYCCNLRGAGEKDTM